MERGCKWEDFIISEELFLKVDFLQDRLHSCVSETQILVYLSEKYNGDWLYVTYMEKEYGSIKREKW